MTLWLATSQVKQIIKFTAACNPQFYEFQKIKITKLCSLKLILKFLKICSHNFFNDVKWIMMIDIRHVYFTLLQ